MTPATEDATEVAPSALRPIGRSTIFRAGLVAIVLTSLLWRYWTVSKWGWFQDDWVYLTKTAKESFGPYVLQNYNGHIMPAQFTIAWLGTKTAPLDYGLAVACTVTFSVGLILCFALLLRQVFGERGRLLAPLFIVAFTPLWMPVTLWWAASLQTFPLAISMCLTLYFVAKYAMVGRHRRYLWGMALAYVGGLMFWEKALLVVVPAIFFIFVLTHGSRRERLQAAKWPALALSIPTAIYLPIYLLLTRSGDAAKTQLLQGRTLRQTADFFLTGILDVGVPGLLGGPWSVLENPQQIFEATSGVRSVLALAAVIVGATVIGRLRRSGVAALTMLCVYALVSWGLLFTSSRFDVIGVPMVRDARYAADILPVALLVTAFAITPTRLEDSHGWLRIAVDTAPRRLISVASAATATLLAIVTLVTNGRIWDASAPNSPGPWTANLIGDIRDAGPISVYDAMALAHVILSAYFWGDGRLSELLRPLNLEARYNAPAETMYIPDWAGHLKEVAIESASSSSPGPQQGCGYLIEPGRTTIIPLKTPLYAWQWGIELSYFSGGPAVVDVSTGRQKVMLALEPGLHHQQFVMEDQISDISVSARSGSSTFCVTDVQVGSVVSSDRWIGDVR